MHPDYISTPAPNTIQGFSAGGIVSPNTQPNFKYSRLERIAKLEDDVTFYTRVLKGFTSMGSEKVVNLVNDYLTKYEDAEKEISVQRCYLQLEAMV